MVRPENTSNVVARQRQTSFAVLTHVRRPSPMIPPGGSTGPETEQSLGESRFNVPAGKSFLSIVRAEFWRQSRFTKLYKVLDEEQTSPIFLEDTIQFTGLKNLLLVACRRSGLSGFSSKFRRLPTAAGNAARIQELRLPRADIDPSHPGWPPLPSIA